MWLCFVEFREKKEYQIGRKGEMFVKNWLTSQGFWVITTGLIEDQGAPALIEEIKTTVIPDLQAGNKDGLRWVEVKTKARTPDYGILKRRSQGIEHWDDYLYVEKATGIPGYLAILVPTDRMLYMGSFDAIKKSVQLYQDPTGKNYKGKKMAFFDINAFPEWHDVSNEGAISTIKMLPPKTIRPWEDTSAPVSKQLSLFEMPVSSRIEH